MSSASSISSTSARDMSHLAKLSLPNIFIFLVSREFGHVSVDDHFTNPLVLNVFIDCNKMASLADWVLMMPLRALGPSSFNFMQFLTKIRSNNRMAPLPLWG